MLVSATDALGHAAFVASQPEPGARLEASPGRVVLAFTEPLNPALSSATLARSGGASVPTEARAAPKRRLALKAKRPLDTGSYRVRWHTVSTEDGHALEGTFSFGVRAQAASSGQDIEVSPLARWGWIRVGLRVALYVTVLLFAAALLVPILVRSPQRSWLAPAVLAAQGEVDLEAIRWRESALVANVGWLAVAAAVAATLAQAADAAGGLSVRGLAEFLLANAAGIARIVVVFALAAGALTAARRPRWAAAFVSTALLAIAASGHASAASPRAVSVLNDWLHIASSAVWLGGIGVLALVWGPQLRKGGRKPRRAAASHVLPAFGRVALPAFAVAASTGLVSLVLQLGRPDALWATGYGRVLVVKMALVGAIAAASAHAWRLRPRLLTRDLPAGEAVERRHWRLVRAEPLIGIGVVAAVALLAAFRCPRGNSDRLPKRSPPRRRAAPARFPSPSPGNSPSPTRRVPCWSPAGCAARRGS